MKTGIIGLEGAGKSTVFEALAQGGPGQGHHAEARVGTVSVPDPRVDHLSGMYRPQKTIHAQVEYFLPARAGQQKESLQKALNQVRDCDALAHVIRNFPYPGLDAPKPREDFLRLDQELVFADLVVVEKRLERVEADHKRGKKMNPEEHALLLECRQILEAEEPLRRHPRLAAAPLLRGYCFLSAKPVLVIFNNPDEVDDPPATTLDDLQGGLVVKAKLERELNQMTPEEAADFMAEFNIVASALDRVIKRTYDLLGLISFFTVGEDEVRAWTIRQGSPALDAAGEIHTDLKKGFIRAEVVGYDDLIAAGGLPEARKRGTLRLEGKTYVVQDGDVVTIRFNI